MPPLELFAQWFGEARRAEKINPEAMTLATVAADGTPQARTVLLKEFSEAGFVFYTNCESRKGTALRQTPRAALLFYWRELGRQISMEGAVQQMSAEETRPYFESRPRDSRIGALASAQSRPLAALADFRAAVAAAEAQHTGQEPPLPPYWRGFRLSPQRFEFWQEGEFRLHRRIAFLPAGAGWRGELLQP